MTEAVDAVQRLEHDHIHLNRMVAGLREAIQECLQGDREPIELRDDFEEFLGLVQEELFEHFEREETGLFPYIAEQLPDLKPVVDALEIAHDRICGVASRMEHMINQGDDTFDQSFDLLVALFARFDANFIKHAREERELLRSLTGRLDATQRAHVAKLLAEL